MCQLRDPLWVSFWLRRFDTIAKMNLTANKASTFVWIMVASLLVVAAVIAGYTVFFRHRPSEREQACSQLQAKPDSLPSHQLTIDSALCTGVTQ